MNVKLRILSYSKKGKMNTFANAIVKKYELTANSIDVIPPAYPCNKERIVLLAVSVGGGSIPDKLRIFARELNKQRAQNVAIYMDGSETAANALINILKEAGTNVIEEVHYVKGGLLPMFSKITPAEETALLEWVDRVLTKLA